MVLQHCEFILSINELCTQKWLISALTTLGLSCGMQALAVVWGSSSLTRDQTPRALHWACGVLTTGPPEKFPKLLILYYVLKKKYVETPRHFHSAGTYGEPRTCQALYEAQEIRDSSYLEAPTCISHTDMNPYRQKRRPREDMQARSLNSFNYYLCSA